MTYERLSNETDAYRRRLLLIGHLTENLRFHGVIPVVVRASVEIYAFKDYATL